MRGERRERRKQRRFRARQRLDERRRDRRIGRRRRAAPRSTEAARPPVRRRRVRERGRLTVTCSHLPRPPARLARAAERGRKPAGIEGQQTDAARSDHALGGVDPAITAAAGDSASRLSTTTIEPVRRRSRRGRAPDPARRARRGIRAPPPTAHGPIREIPGPGRASDVLPPARWLAASARLAAASASAVSAATR